MPSRLLFALTLAVAPAVSGAASLEINPGLWETTMTSTNPMTGGPTTDTKTECVKEKSFDHREVMEEADGCRLVDESLSGDTLSFSMQCDLDGGAQAIMDGTFQTDGQTGTGNMTINMNMAGMTMTMTNNWTSRRVGDC